MKKELLWICLLLLFGKTITAQTLRGKVYDQQHQTPVSNANVYLEGTSYLTITGEDGSFTLTVKKPVNTRLVISHIGYETEVFTRPFEQLPEQIFLLERSNILSDFTVTSKGKDKYKRSTKMAIFRRQFLGDVAINSVCRIRNEDDIKLIYDSENRVLSAFCDKPIQIENKYLGYELQFDLTRFDLYFSDNSLSEYAVSYVYYTGYPRFTDVKPQDAQIHKRRKEIYEYAASNFFRQLSVNLLTQSPFSLYKNRKIGDASDCFEVTDMPTHKMISLKPLIHGQDDNKSYTAPVFGQVTVLHKDSRQSQITFFTDTFTVDSYGNVSPVGQLFFSGFMGNQRMGDLLPLEYEPE